MSLSTVSSCRSAVASSRKQRLASFQLAEVLDASILILIFSQLLFLDYFDLSAIPKRLAVALIALRFICSKVKLKPSMLLVFCIFVLLGALNAASNTFESGAFLYNVKLLVYPFAYVLYLAWLVRSRGSYVRSVFKAAFAPVNIYFFLTTAVAFVQYNFHVLIAVNDGSYPKIGTWVYWADAAGGLFKFCGVHALCLFTVFCILYNLWISETGHDRKALIARALVALELVVGLSLAALNDNKALFFLLPVGIIVYLFSFSSNCRIRFSRKALIAVPAVLLLFALLLGNGDCVQYLREHVVDEVGRAIGAIGKSFDATGTEERFGILAAAFSIPSTWLFGEGVAAHRWISPGYLGFPHFGQADAGVVLILGGIWFALVYVGLYLRAFLAMARIDFVEGKAKKSLLLAVFFLLVLVYTRVMSTIAYTLSFSLICMIFGLIWEDRDFRSRRSIEACNVPLGKHR